MSALATRFATDPPAGVSLFVVGQKVAVNFILFTVPTAHNFTARAA